MMKKYLQVLPLQEEHFLDRLVANFDVSHNQRINSYNKLLQQRSKDSKKKLSRY